MQISLVFVGSTLLAAGMAVAQAANGLTVNTLPAITTCVANRLSWTGGQAPYTVFIIVPGQPASILAQLGQTNDNFLVYRPDGSDPAISAGQSVSVYVTDGSGFSSASAGSPIISGGTCSGGSSSSAAPSSVASTSTSSTAAPTSSSSTTAAPTTTTTSTTTSSTTRTTTTTTTSTTTTAPAGAAAPALNGLTAVVAGAVGVLAAALI